MSELPDFLGTIPQAELELWFLAAIAVFAAGLAKGLTGFGSALILAPVLGILYGPAATVLIITIMDLPATLFLLPSAVRECERRSVSLLALGALLGIPLGVQVLTVADPDVMKTAIAALVLAMAFIMALGWRYRGAAGAPQSFLAGLFGGLMGGSTGVGGPPVVLFWLGTQPESRIVRANLIAYFTVTSVVGIGSLVFFGLFSWYTVLIAGSLVPVFSFGLWAGAQCFPLVSNERFRHVSLSLIAMAGISGLVF